MNFSESLRRWQRIAAGDLKRDQYDPIDLQAWIQDVASKIVVAADAAAKDRPGALQRALGLSGGRSDLDPIEDELRVLDSFAFYDKHGNEREPRRGERLDNLIAAVRRSGLLDDVLTDDEIRKRLDRMFAR